MISRFAQVIQNYKNPRLWIRNILWRLPSTVSNADVVFVVGAPRSGTTLLQRVLSLHSGLFSIQSETGLFSYQNIFDSSRSHFGLPRDELERMFGEAKDVVDFFHKGVQRLSLEHEGRIFVEKTPQHVLHLRFILRHFPRARIIHVVRDGRDCFCSAKSHPRIPQNKSAQRFAAYWRKCVSAALPYADHERMFTVRYEEFASNSRVRLAEIMEFLCLEVEDRQLDLSLVGADHRANLDEFKRLSQVIDTASVGRWMFELTPEERQTFQDVAGDALLRYGYRLEASPSAQAGEAGAPTQ